MSFASTVFDPKRRTGLVLALVVLVVSPAIGQQVLLSADFESGLPPGWTATDLCHVTNACPQSNWCGSGQWAYFGADATCSVDGTNTMGGVLTAPAVLLPGAGPITLSYCSASQLQPAFFPPLNAAWVEVNGVIVDTASDDLIADFVTETRVVDLTSYAGQTVTISFHLNSIDGWVSALGWMVDGISLTGPACTGPDSDGDGVADMCDNCVTAANPGQEDADNDGIGDVCDGCTNSDNDTHCDADDNCPTDDNEDQADGDTDGVGDVCDACTGNDGVGDADGDGVCSDLDNCAFVANAGQADADGDGIGHPCCRPIGARPRKPRTVTAGPGPHRTLSTRTSFAAALWVQLAFGTPVILAASRLFAQLFELPFTTGSPLLTSLRQRLRPQTTKAET